MAHIVKKLPQNKWEKTRIFSYVYQLSKTETFVISLSLSSRSCRAFLKLALISGQSSFLRASLNPIQFGLFGMHMVQGGGRILPYRYHELSSAYLSPESAKNGLK